MTNINYEALQTLSDIVGDALGPMVTPNGKKFRSLPARQHPPKAPSFPQPHIAISKTKAAGKGRKRRH